MMMWSWKKLGASYWIMNRILRNWAVAVAVKPENEAPEWFVVIPKPETAIAPHCRRIRKLGGIVVGAQICTKINKHANT